MVTDRIKAVPITDGALIKKILFNPVIWDAISEDGTSQEKFDIDEQLQTNTFVGIYANSVLIGVYILHQWNNATLQIHANILPEHREKWALQSGFAILEYILKNAPTQFEKLIAFVPENYKNVINFCKKCGFAHEGTNRKAYRKNGELYDIELMGITRSEIATWVSLKIQSGD